MRGQQLWYQGARGDGCEVVTPKLRHVFEALRARALLPPAAIHTDAALDGAQPAAPPIDLARLRRVHSDRYLHALLSGQPREVACAQGLARWTPDIARAWLLDCGGLWAASLAAIAAGGITCNLGHGYHRAGLDRARDFCAVNGLAVVADALVREKHARKVLIVDLDEHEGDGTAELVIGKAPIFHLTIFGHATGGPAPASNHLPVRVDHAARAARRERDLHYLATIAAWLPAVIRRHDPDVILYQAGVDPYDGSGVSARALATRDAYVFALARHFERPLCWVLGGGRSPLDVVVPQHLATFEQASHVLAEVTPDVEVALEPRGPADDIYDWSVSAGRARFCDWPALAGRAAPRRPRGLSPAEARAFETRRVAQLAAQRLDDDALQAAFGCLWR